MDRWYSHLKYQDFGSQHVLARLFDGTTIAGPVCYDSFDEDQGSAYTKGDCTGFVCMGTNFAVVQNGGLSHMPAYIPILFCAEDGRWYPVTGVKSIDLVWDERDWMRIKLSDAGDGDVLVVCGGLYPITETHFVDDPVMPVWWSVASGSYIVAPDMVSCALRRKAQVPAEPGFYKDGSGEYWAKAAKPEDDRLWRAVEPDALDQPARSEEDMANLMALTPVHFVDGRAA